MTNEVNEDVLDVPELTPTLDADGNDTTDWKAIAEANRELALKNQGIAKRFKTKAEKAKETTPPAVPVPPKEPKSDDNVLLQKLEKMALRQAGLTDPEDVELARNTAKKWNMDIDEVIADDDFKVKLEKQQTARANTVATSSIKGGAANSQAKNTPEYWIASGKPPTREQVSDRKVRAKILRAFMDKGSSTGKKFYND